MRKASTKRLAETIVVFIVVSALLVLIGWGAGIEALKRIRPGMTAMNPMTAICFLLCGIWFWLNVFKERYICYLKDTLAFLILLAGLIKLSEYAGWIQVYYDRILFTSQISREPGFNAIAPNTALLFFTTGILMLNRKRSLLARNLNDYLKLMGLLIAYLGLIGYVYGMKSAYQIGPFVPMALSTSVLFLAVFTVCFLAMPRGRMGFVITADLPGGRFARRALPVMLWLPAMFGYLRLLGEKVGLYDREYGTALYTAFFVIVLFLLVYYYAIRINEKEEERNVIDHQIKESEEKYRSLVGAMKEGVVYYDLNGRIIFCNDSFRQILGQDSGDLIGKDIIELMAPVGARNVFKQKLLERAKGASEDYEIEVTHKLGFRIWISVTSRPIVNDEDAVVASFATITDITEDKKHIEELDAFSASAAHDLNAPLARIEMLTALLEDGAKGRLNEDEKEFLALIKQTTGSSRMMLKDLLRFSKLSAANLHKKDIPMADMVQEIAASLQHTNPRAEIRVGELPVVQADESALRQVYNNLISNALKYSSKVSEPKVEIGYETNDSQYVFFVKDNGAGFDMANESALFAPFQRLHINFEGNGLGLPIVKRIIEKHGGRIWADSRPGEGASFYFTL